MNWDLIIDQSGIASVLPAEYVRFARPVRDALTVFLNGLPRAEQQAVLAAQAKLPARASVSQRLCTLALCCPVLHKLGQVLGRDERLLPQLRRHLQSLESLPPSIPLDAIQNILAEELGPLDRLGVTLTPPAIAEASVAVVIPFLQNGHAEKGVFKVLKPGIQERLELELDLLDRVGSHLDQQCDEVQIPHLDYQESFQQVRDKLSNEIRLDQEQKALSEAREFYRDEPRVQIPALFDCCTPRVTAMQYMTGGKITDHRLQCVHDRRRLAELVTEALITQPVFSTADAAIFHGDPHAGNLFLTDDGRLALLDWSLVGSLGERERIALVQIMLGAITLNARRIMSVLEELSLRQPIDRLALKNVVLTWLGQIRRGRVPMLTWLIGMLDDAVQTARLRVSADLMLFRKSLHTLDGVVTAVGADSGLIDRVLCVQFLRHFAVDWIQRGIALPSSRNFATRLSNLDLASTLWSYPATVARLWFGHGLDLLGTSRSAARVHVMNDKGNTIS